MGSQKEFKVLNWRHENDKDVFIEETPILPFVKFTEEKKNDVQIAELVSRMKLESFDLCFLHPKEYEIILDKEDFHGGKPIIIYSGEYAFLDDWLSDHIVKLPKVIVKKRWREIIAIIQKHPGRDLHYLLLHVLFERDTPLESDDSHKIRNICGPGTLFNIMREDGYVPANYKEYILSKIPSKESLEEKRYRTSVNLPFDPPAFVAAKTSLLSGRLLIVDDDHRRGWSALLACMMNSSTESYCELSPQVIEKSNYEFAIVPVSGQSAPDLMISNVWELTEVKDRNKSYAVAIQQVGREVPKSDFKTGESDISAFTSLFTRGSKEKSHKELIPFDVAFIDFRAQNEHVDIESKDVSGLKIVKFLKQVDPSLPTIVFTASAKAKTVLSLLKHDILGYYQKPGRLATKEDRENYKQLKQLVRIAKDYWWLRFIWGTSVWLSDESTPIRREFDSDEYDEYLLSRLGLPFDGNKIKSSRIKKDIVVKRLEQITRLIDTRRMADAGTIDSMSVPGLNSELASQLGMIGDYLTGGAGAGEPENPNKKIRTVFGHSVLFYCLQISRSTRNIAAHGGNDILKNHLVVIVQLMTILKALFKKNLPDEVISFVPEEYWENTLNTEELMLQYKKHILEDKIITSSDYLMGGGSSSVKVLTVGADLKKDLENHMSRLWKENEIQSIEKHIQDRFNGTHISKQDKTKEMATALQNYLEEHKLPDPFLVFFSFFRAEVFRKNDELLLCTNYLLLARQIELSGKNDRDLQLLHNMLLIVAKQTIDDI